MKKAVALLLLLLFTLPADACHKDGAGRTGLFGRSRTARGVRGTQTTTVRQRTVVRAVPAASCPGGVCPAR